MNSNEMFNLSDDELTLAASKNTSKNKLGFAILLKYFQLEGHYPKNISAPIKNVISSEWDGLVSINEQGIKKIHRVNYEIAILQELRKKLGCKMIWIEGALRYRNPDDDLPKDFEENREYYYNLLGLSINVHDFTVPRKKQLHENLKLLNDTILTNEKVEITNKNGGHIKISPL